MPVVIIVLVVLLVLSGIGQAYAAGQGGTTKSAGACLLDLLIDILLVVWLLVVFL